MQTRNVSFLLSLGLYFLFFLFSVRRLPASEHNSFCLNSSLNAENTFKQVLKESVVALINATIISMLVYIYNFIRFGATATVSYSVSISLFAVVMFASIFGTLVPMTLEKLKIDPAIATGPFISITNDIIGMLMYMGITVLLS